MPRFGFGLAALVMLSFGMPAPANAQSFWSRGKPAEQGAGAFDFYVLALSWSNTFCALTGRARGARQCDGSNPGFVLHGLWPQNERGFPQDCGPDGRSPARAAMARALEVFPEPGLARHEWRKHGTCSGLSPEAYFDAAASARARVMIPPGLQAPRVDAEMDVQAIERAFVAANPGLRADMLAVTCTRNQLEEVRVCLTKDLRAFRPCEEVDRRACRVRRVTVPAS